MQHGNAGSSKTAPLLGVPLSKGNGLDTFGPNAPFLPKRLFEQQDIISRLLNPFSGLQCRALSQTDFLEKSTPLILGGGNPASAFARSAVAPVFSELFCKLVEKRSIREPDILRLHTVLAPGAQSGLREVNVRCGGFDTSTAIYVPPPPKNIPGLTKDIALFAAQRFEFDRGLIQSIVLAIQILIVHPFHDGNGRVSRALFALCACRSRGYDMNAVDLLNRIYSGDGLLAFGLSFILTSGGGWQVDTLSKFFK